MGAGLQGGDARETLTFTLLLCDERGEPIRPPTGHSARNLNENVDAWSDLDNFNVHAHLVSSSSKNIIDVAAQRPTPTGAVVCTYSVPEKGNYTLNVTVNGEHAQGSPTPLFFGPPAKDETTAKLGDNNATETPAAAAGAAAAAAFLDSAAATTTETTAAAPPPTTNTATATATATTSPTANTGRMVLLTNLPVTATEAAVNNIASQYGMVTSLQILAPGSAKVEYVTAVMASAAAAALQGISFDPAHKIVATIDGDVSVAANAQPNALDDALAAQRRVQERAAELARRLEERKAREEADGGGRDRDRDRDRYRDRGRRDRRDPYRDDRLGGGRRWRRRSRSRSR
ncbi:hypothetical protein PPROV_001035200 [Pycnococcus provasolii]|uniref:RRM domain-containing protein n=1 Tax=Pycnococcus provasolii TaxID=41880 RepID=A0A830HWT5_9CHLO|nr:hypothetical protein PPROV_001035200 [Pycnococcus provasolii]